MSDQLMQRLTSLGASFQQIDESFGQVLSQGGQKNLDGYGLNAAGNRRDKSSIDKTTSCIGVQSDRLQCGNFLKEQIQQPTTQPASMKMTFSYHNC